MRPHHVYRGTLVLIPFGMLLTALSAFTGSWLGVANGALVTIVGVVNLVVVRRRGYGWNSPKTFRELRAMEAKRREQP
jgi:hypothetical protein